MDWPKSWSQQCHMLDGIPHQLPAFQRFWKGTAKFPHDFHNLSLCLPYFPHVCTILVMFCPPVWFPSPPWAPSHRTVPGRAPAPSAACPRAPWRCGRRRSAGRVRRRSRPSSESSTDGDGVGDDTMFFLGWKLWGTPNWILGKDSELFNNWEMVDWDSYI